MLLSIALIFLIGFFMGKLFLKLGLPSLVGMLLTGIVLGPFALGLIDASVLDISAEIRRAALLVILLRAGTSLELSDIKKAGRPAALLCFLPACFEIGGMLLLAPLLTGVTLKEAALMGAVVAAVSPAVVVPRMINLMDENYGTDKSIPQMILAGASVDDVFVIVLFSVFLGIEQGEGFSWLSIAGIPISLVTGVAVGVASGLLISLLYNKVKLESTAKTLILLSAAMLLSALENALPDFIPFASLIAVMISGMAIKSKAPESATALKSCLNKLWIPAEIFLFVLVGASVDVSFAVRSGAAVVLLVLCVLLFRLVGVFVCLFGTRLLPKEKLFCAFAYMPKATVQAAIGGIPLAMGLSCGNIVLTAAVIAILVTAPLGAFLIDATYKRFLCCEKNALNKVDNQT